MRIRNKYYVELAHGAFPEPEVGTEEPPPPPEPHEDSGPETFIAALRTEQHIVDVDAHHMRPVACTNEAWALIRAPCFGRSHAARLHAKQQTDAINMFLDYYNDHLFEVYSDVMESMADAGIAPSRPSYALLIDAIAGALKFQQVTADAHGDEDGPDTYVGGGHDDAPGVKHPEISYL